MNKDEIQNGPGAQAPKKVGPFFPKAFARELLGRQVETSISLRKRVMVCVAIIVIIMCPVEGGVTLP